MGMNMIKRYLVILEVSQKQAFIFSSNKLKENVVNSAIIAWVTDSDFFHEVINDNTIYQEEENLVYAGGGHTVLVFDTRDRAKEFVFRITRYIHNNYQGLEMFAKIQECEGEIGGTDLEKLSQELEKKKSQRKATFHQRSFGIEKKNFGIEKSSSGKKEVSGLKMPEKELKIDQELFPQGFTKSLELERLGGSKEESNFIAVIHIDGNSMGKRVETLRKSLEGMEWEDYRKALRKFSESVDKDFKSAYKEMADTVADLLMRGKLEKLKLQTGDFPIRRVITAGDDICFITEGRIGLECARIFIEKLASKKNEQDEQHYAACAGVAIVHQKYPFYRAYELSEELCSNAKRFIATTANMEGSADVSAEVSAIDWHIEYGEMKDGLEEIREMYHTIEWDDKESNDTGKEHQHLELRPYILLNPKGFLKSETIREYRKFRKLMLKIQNGNIDYARGKLKEFRQYLKEGEKSAKHYIRTMQIGDLDLLGYQDIFVTMDMSGIGSGKSLDRKTFVRTVDGKKRSLYFDVIEMLDTFIPLEEQGE